MNSNFDLDILNDELDSILDINMEDFGFFKAEDINLDEFFEEKEEQQEEKKEETIICPYCGKEFIKE